MRTLNSSIQLALSVWLCIEVGQLPKRIHSAIQSTNGERWGWGEMCWELEHFAHSWCVRNGNYAEIHIQNVFSQRYSGGYTFVQNRKSIVLCPCPHSPHVDERMQKRDVCALFTHFLVSVIDSATAERWDCWRSNINMVAVRHIRMIEAK